MADNESTPNARGEFALPEDELSEWLQQARDWISSKWGAGRSCPYCGKDDWSIGPELVELRPYGPGPPYTVTPGVYTAFQVFCETCGNTVLVNAVIAGLPEPEPPVDEDGPSVAEDEK